MSTTHKSLDGPRGAVLLTTDAAIAKKIDKAVFPGEQGGPHVHIFAALALTFKLAQTKQFKKLQAQTVKNAAGDGRPVQEARTAHPVRRHGLPPGQRGRDHGQGRRMALR